MNDVNGDCQATQITNKMFRKKMVHRVAFKGTLRGICLTEIGVADM